MKSIQLLLLFLLNSGAFAFNQNLEKGLNYFESGDYNMALPSLQAFLDSHEEKEIRGEVFFKIGWIYRYKKKDPGRAIPLLDSARILLSQTVTKNDSLLSETLYNLASAHRSQGKYSEALSYARQALKIANSRNAIKQVAKFMVMVANIYNNQLRLSEANKYYLKAIEITLELNPQDPYLAYYYDNLAISYRNLNLFDSAEYYLNKSHEINKKYKSNRMLANYYFTLAHLRRESRQLTSSLDYFNKCLSLRSIEFGKHHPEVALVYSGISRVWRALGELDKALEYGQQALIALDSSLVKKPYGSLPNIASLTDKQTAFLVLFYQSELHYSKLQKDPNTVEINHALSTYIKTDSILKLNKSVSVRTETKLFLQEHYNDFYSYYLDALYLKYENEKSAKLVETIFSVMESNKALVLLEKLESNGSTGSHELDSLSELAEELKNQLNLISLSTNEHTELEIKEFELTNAFNQIQQTINKKFPAYYELKNKNFTSFTDVQERLNSNNQSLLSMLDGRNYVYLLFTDGSKYSVNKFLKDSVYKSQIEKFYKQVYSVNYLFNAKDSYAEYTESAYFLYNRFFKFIDLSTSNQLIIVPDGTISYLPFESLIVARANRPFVIDYKRLSYLLKEINISYAYSVSFMERNYLKPNNSNLLGIGFENNDHSNLIGVTAELVTIQSLWPEKNHIEFSSSETFFKENANKYGIIHLGLHGNADSTYLNSVQLVFSDEGSNDNGLLDAKEIYNLNLNAGLVFLSSCETGFGKLSVGEGIFSIARGFIYAGSKSVVQTLWKVNDRLSSKIVSVFYEKLAAGSIASEALAKSKLQYISQSDELAAHPYNWAAFQLIGDYQKAKASKNEAIVFFLIFTCVLAVLLGIKFKKSSKKTTKF